MGREIGTAPEYACWAWSGKSLRFRELGYGFTDAAAGGVNS